MDVLFIVGFLGIVLALVIFAIVVSIKQHKCKHVNATAFPYSSGGYVTVVCHDCKRTEVYKTENRVVSIFDTFTGRRIKVTRVSDEKGNRTWLEVEKIN